MVTEKVEIRKDLRNEIENWLSSLSPSIRHEMDDQITQKISGWLKGQSGTWASFHAVGFEPDVSKLTSMNPEIKWCYPKITGELLQFYSDVEAWQTNKWGLNEPAPEKSKIVPLSKISGFLVPGLAFDVEGVRLGRGKGYYDKTLKDNSGIKIGVAYAKQVCDDLICEAHDVRMDYLVTDLEWRKVSSKWK